MDSQLLKVGKDGFGEKMLMVNLELVIISQELSLSL